MKFENQQKGSALIALMVVVCIIGVLFYYIRGNGEQEGANQGSINTIKTYNKATDDLGEIRKDMDRQNNLIKEEIMATSTTK